MNHEDNAADAWIQREIVRIRCIEFPWDMTRALELALFRTFASPRIGGLLFSTGEFLARSQKRYDDTDLLLSEIVENGYTSERGARALARMNEIHARFKIRNEDFHSAAYERENFRHTQANQAVAHGVIELFATWYPAPARPLVRGSIPALLDDAMCVSLGIPVPSARRRRIVGAALRLKARLVRALPRRRKPVLRCAMPRADHPTGYSIHEVGSPPSGAPPLL